MRLLACVLLAAATAAAQVPSSAVQGLNWRAIGPASTGGRIADFAVAHPPGQPETMYVGTASGGVFKSSNQGVSWVPVFDHSGGMMSIGAVAVAPSNPSIVWVGTGEVDNRQSSSWGNGIYKSLDGGATWQSMGLENTRHIAKILIDPTNPDVVYVAALGHLWGPNPDRGVYKTTDGGRTWKKVLYHDDNTGATDLAMSPANPQLLYAALYQRQRKGWGFNGGGPGSGIYRSSDGGASWTELTRGLPSGDKGRIGLAVNSANPSEVYAIVEADPQPAGRGAPGGAPAAPRVLRGGVFRSFNQGQSWEHLSSLNPRPSYYSRIYLDPSDPNRVYIMGSERGFYISDDGGRNFRDVFSQVHGEDHVMWLDPTNPNHILIGGDGGVSISYDRGETWSFRNDLPIGQFYDISTNDADPYLVCGGLQDNGNWCVPEATVRSVGIANGDTFNVGGGDGMQAVFDGDNKTLLVSSQNGSTTRLSLDTFERQNIGPVPPETQPQPGQPGYRWYWTAPLIVSHFTPKVIYTGANILFRSPDQGVTWKAISPDLTAHLDRTKLQMMGGPIPSDALSKNDGQDNFSALTVIAESPLDAKLLYTGADDGTLQVTRDGGAHWTNITSHVPGLPAMTNVSGIEPSRYVPGRVYASFDGHFNDDYHPYVYVSEDYGATWKPIASGLPETSVHRIRENPKSADFLVAGTEEGVYASWDRGANWTSLNTNLPPVPVYDLVYQKTTGDLVLGTHGRSIWVLDAAGALSQIGAHAGAAYLFPIAPARKQTVYAPQAWYGAGEYFAPNPPTGAVVSFEAPEGTRATATVTISANGRAIRHFPARVRAGFNQAVWDLRYDAPIPAPTVAGRGGRGGAVAGGGGGGRGRGGNGPTVEPGNYQVSMQWSGAPPLTGTIEVTGPAGAPERTRALLAAYRLQQQLAPARAAVAAAEKQLQAMDTYVTALQTSGASAAAVSSARTALEPISASLERAISGAAGAQRAIDNYDGAPTAAQLRQLAWAEQDAHAAVASLNQFLKTQMAAAYQALSSKPAWVVVSPVTMPADASSGGR